MEQPEETPEVEGPQRKARGCVGNLLVAIAVFAFLFMLMLPAINSAREAGRRASCVCHEKQIGLGLQNFASAFQALPSACYIAMPDGPNKGKPGGFSFFVKFLPFLCYDNLYSLASPTDDPLDPQNLKTQQGTYDLNSTPIKEFFCPSNSNAKYLDSRKSSPWNATNQAWAVTTYVGMGATCPQSLALSLNQKAKAPYGTTSIHPDGVIYPTANSTGARFADIPDGTSHTVCVCETIDYFTTAWTVGLDCVMTGMPDQQPSKYVRTEQSEFFCDPDFDKTFGDASPAAIAARADATCLSWPFVWMDFSPGGKQQGFYEKYGVAPHYSPLPPGAPGPRAHMYGPSSSHPGSVTCLFVDGRVSSFSKKIDPALWFFKITRANADPFYSCEGDDGD